jgi:uncharacterized membrane protein
VVERPADGSDTARLEAFSDGVFAIAITLLVLEVHLPTGNAPLTHKLWAAWPSYVGYLLSFVTIGIMWANHHAVFRLIGRTTHGLVVGNLALLMTVAFLPFPTSVLAENIRNAGGDHRTAAVFYSATFVAIAIGFQALWQVASRGHRLIVRGGEAAADQVSRGYRWGIPAYAVSTLLALWQPAAGLALVGAMAVYWLVPRGHVDPSG